MKTDRKAPSQPAAAKPDFSGYDRALRSQRFLGATHAQAQPLSLRLSQLLTTSLKLGTPVLFSVIGAAMLLYGWTTP